MEDKNLKDVPIWCGGHCLRVEVEPPGIDEGFAMVSVEIPSASCVHLKPETKIYWIILTRLKALINFKNLCFVGSSVTASSSSSRWMVNLNLFWTLSSGAQVMCEAWWLGAWIPPILLLIWEANSDNTGSINWFESDPLLAPRCHCRKWLEVWWAAGNLRSRSWNPEE